MRIVAGAAKGRRLTAPSSEGVRPTADRVKEALFASLQPLLAGARVLDLYAGTGALGLEALSRGAATVTFVERDRAALDALRRNIATVGLPGTHVVAADVARAVLDELPGAPYDLVVADPPYQLPRAAVVAMLAALPPVLADDAVVVLERSVREGDVTWPEGLRAGDPRRYGETVLLRAVHDPAPSSDPDAAADAPADAPHKEPS